MYEWMIKKTKMSDSIYTRDEDEHDLDKKPNMRLHFSLLESIRMQNTKYIYMV